MMRHRVTAAVCLLLLVAVLGGCATVQRLWPWGEPVVQLDPTDRLVGVIVTTDTQAYELGSAPVFLNFRTGIVDNVGHVIYPVLGGAGFTSSRTISNLDVRVFGRPLQDTPRMLTGTIYVTPSFAAANAFAFGVVYQQDDREVYFVPTRADDGWLRPEAGANITKFAGDLYMDVTMTIEVAHYPRGVVILQMDEGGNLVDRGWLPAGTQSGRIVPIQGVEFIVVEHHGSYHGQAIVSSRTIFSRNDYATLPHVFHTLSERGDGVLTQQQMTIDWR